MVRNHNKILRINSFCDFYFCIYRRALFFLLRHIGAQLSLSPLSTIGDGRGWLDRGQCRRQTGAFEIEWKG